MELSIQSDNDTTRIRVEGSIDAVGAEQLKSAFNGLQLSQHKAVAFDFGKVTHIGSAGLGKLLLFYQKLASKRMEMRVENPSPTLRELLHELRLDGLFQVV